MEKRSSEADRDTFEVLNLLFAKDQEKVFDLNGVISEADAATFVVLDDAKKSRYPAAGYAKDKNAVYHEQFQLQKADLQSWEMLNEFYSRDHDRVYFLHKIIKEADLESFKIIPGILPLAEDKDYRYQQDQKKQL